MDGETKGLTIFCSILAACLILGGFGSCSYYNKLQHETKRVMVERGFSGSEINCAMNSYETTSCFKQEAQ